MKKRAYVGGWVMVSTPYRRAEKGVLVYTEKKKKKKFNIYLVEGLAICNGRYGGR